MSDMTKLDEAFFEKYGLYGGLLKLQERVQALEGLLARWLNGDESPALRLDTRKALGVDDD